MPFDHADRSGGGGRPDDPRHKGIQDVAAATLEALGLLTKVKGLCLDCMAVEIAASSMALLFLQQGAIDHQTGEVDPDEMQSLMQVVTDVAMKRAGDTVEARKAHRERKG